MFYPAEHVRRIELDAKCIYKHRNAGNLNKFEMRGWMCGGGGSWVIAGEKVWRGDLIKEKKKV